MSWGVPLDVDLHHILSASDVPRRVIAPPARSSKIMRFRRARTLLCAVVLFWLWVWLGSASMVAGLFHVPLWAMLVTYALAVSVLVSFPLALGAAVQMHLMRTGPTPAAVIQNRARTYVHVPSPIQGDVVRFPRRPAQPPTTHQLSRGA